MVANNDRPTYLILDETQMIYQVASHFWQKVKNLIENRKNRSLHIIAFAAYGDQPIDDQLQTDFSTPVAFPRTLGPSFLYCSEEETQDLIEDFNKKNPLRLKVDHSLQTYLYKLTSGHIGHLLLLLYWLQNKLHNLVKHGHLDPQLTPSSPLSTGMVAEQLLSFGVLQSLRSSIFRAFPKFEGLDDDCKSCLQELLEQDECCLEPTLRSTFNELRKRRIVHWKEEDTTIEFVSPLVRQLCMWEIVSSKRPHKGPTTLEDFLLELLKGIKPSFLKKNLSRGKDGKLLERSWQMEFYRIATSILPSGSHVCPDVGHTFGSTGLADFYVNDDKKWVVELTREGDRLQQHLDQAKPSGLYGMLPYKKYLVVDFRSSTPRSAYMKDDVWYVVYGEELQSARLLRKGQDPLEISFKGDDYEESTEDLLQQIEQLQLKLARGEHLF